MERLKRLHKFLYLSSADRRLVAQSVVLVWAMRLGLWLLPFRILRRLLARVTKSSSKLHKLQERDRASVDRVVWAVTIASRYVPAATCLTQSLATKVLLSRRGHQASVHIGVARSEAGQFQAHAWVENDGIVVIGGPESQLKRYTPLPASGEETV